MLLPMNERVNRYAGIPTAAAPLKHSNCRFVMFITTRDFMRLKSFGMLTYAITFMKNPFYKITSGQLDPKRVIYHRVLLLLFEA